MNLFIFTYETGVVGEDANTYHRSILGHKLLDTKIEKEKRQFVLDVQKFESGIYNYQLICGGNILSNGQFSVIK